jgi:hypothetical protein
VAPRDLAGQDRPVARFREVASAVVDRIYRITSSISGTCPAALTGSVQCRTCPTTLAVDDLRAAWPFPGLTL